MTKTQELVTWLENERGSRVIVYITGDRKPFTTKVASDVIHLFQEHLELLGTQQKLSLFLHTRGGDMITPLRLVKLLREYCEQLEVLVPYMSHSAGTLLCLGADKIVMGKLSELSPVDPSMTHPFSPSNPANPKEKLEISVEDINSYFLFATDKARVRKGQIVELYKSLVQQVHPLLLGGAYRAQRMAKMLAERSLKLHMSNRWKIGKIVRELTSDLCIHGYPITRDEAEGLGLPVERANQTLDTKMHKLFNEYATMLELRKPFQPNAILHGSDKVELEVASAIIHSPVREHRFIYKATVTRKEGNQVGIDIDSNKWELYNDNSPA